MGPYNRNAMCRHIFAIESDFLCRQQGLALFIVWFSYFVYPRENFSLVYV